MPPKWLEMLAVCPPGACIAGGAVFCLVAGVDPLPRSDIDIWTEPPADPWPFWKWWARHGGFTATYTSNLPGGLPDKNQRLVVTIGYWARPVQLIFVKPTSAQAVVSHFDFAHVQFAVTGDGKVWGTPAAISAVRTGRTVVLDPAASVARWLKASHFFPHLVMPVGLPAAPATQDRITHRLTYPPKPPYDYSHEVLNPYSSEYFVTLRTLNQRDALGTLYFHAERDDYRGADFYRDETFLAECHVDMEPVTGTVLFNQECHVFVRLSDTDILRLSTAAAARGLQLSINADSEVRCRTSPFDDGFPLQDGDDVTLPTSTFIIMGDLAHPYILSRWMDRRLRRAWVTACVSV